jgi:hypothetical protein
MEMWTVVWVAFAGGAKKFALVRAASGDEAKLLALSFWGLEPDPMDGFCSVAKLPDVGGARVLYAA